MASKRSSTFRDAEQLRQAALKRNSALFSERARADGVARTRFGPIAYGHLLPAGSEQENLVPEYRRELIALFQKLGIVWHLGTASAPGANLLSSQVCAANFLAPFIRDADLAASWLAPLLPDFSEVLPIENVDGPLYLTFEYIGQDDYLGELKDPTRRRTRGRHYTSTDAAVCYRRLDGTAQIVLIEWKYTECYGATSLAVSKSGTDRREIYRDIANAEWCPISAERYEAVFHEPFYQLFRQQALAAAMQRTRDQGVDRVTVLHISPAANTELHRVTSPSLRALGTDVFEVWKSVLRNAGDFTSIDTAAAFRPFLASCPERLNGWYDYISHRYARLLSPAPRIASDTHR